MFSTSMNRNLLQLVQCNKLAINTNTMKFLPTIISSTNERGFKSVHNPLNKRRRKKRSSYQPYRFLDKITVTATAGMGGSGCISHEFLNPWKKRPTGGHGGDGGSVIIMVDNGEQNLPLGRKLIRGGNGGRGGSNLKGGKAGENYILRVPRGVVVWMKREFHTEEEEITDRRRLMQDDPDKFMLQEEEDFKVLQAEYEEREQKEREQKALKEREQEADSEEEDEDDDLTVEDGEGAEEEAPLEFLADLDQSDSYLVIAKGGRGGRGNGAMGRSNIQDTSFSYPQIGESIQIVLELKLIADVGFLGYPNAGKSSLLFSLSQATPKIAPYKFTTLYPKLGTIQYQDDTSISCADLPGLVEGASEGRGRGFHFLKHVERTRVLLYLIDIKNKPVQILKSLLEELQHYNNGHLLCRKAIIVVNKTDLLSPSQTLEKIKEIQRFVEEQQEFQMNTNDVIGISAGVTGDGLERLTQVIRSTVLEERRALK